MNVCKHCKRTFSNRSNNFHRHEKSCDGSLPDTNHTTGKCKHCQEVFILENHPKGWMANHSRWCQKNPKRKSYEDANKPKLELMEKSRKNTGFTNQFTKAKQMGDEIPKSKLVGRQGKSTPHTEETKDTISNKRKEYLKNNPDKHPWKNSTKVSKPCENFKSFLRSKGVEFEEEFQPLEDRYFSIDIAFTKAKIGIEINGNQHYEKDLKTLKPYYQERHDLITSNGWILLELHYSKFFKEEQMQLVLENIIRFAG